MLVVGSAQSGAQITEDLLAAGRSVLLATSPVGHAPSRHRGRDTVALLLDCGFFQQRRDELPDPAVITAPQPLLAPGGRSISLQELARAGATLTGRLIGVDGYQLTFDHTLHANIAYGDAFADRIRAMLDHHLIGSDIDPAKDAVSHEHQIPTEPPAGVNLRAAGITSVIWCTGYRGDLTWLPPALLNRDTNPSTTTVPRHRPVSDTSVFDGSATAPLETSSASPQTPSPRQKPSPATSHNDEPHGDREPPPLPLGHRRDRYV